jgi:hypothetical protein
MVVEMLVRKVIDGQVRLSVELVDTYAEKRPENSQRRSCERHPQCVGREAECSGSSEENRVLNNNLL